MAKKKRRSVKITIISPASAQTFKLGISPVEARINLQAAVFIDGQEATKSVVITWKLRLSWEATYNTYQTKVELSGNSLEAVFQSGGILRIRAAVIVDDEESSTRMMVKIDGVNPDKKEIAKLLDTDILKAVAWEESGWLQFNAKGEPLLPIKPKGQRIPGMRGIFQISEWWWGRDKRITHQDYIKVAWQYDYNIETGKEILDFLHNRAIAKYPKDSAEKIWDRTFKAYHEGEASFNTLEKPEEFWYVKNVRKTLREKPWAIR
ncbi:hypothetical protein HZB07_06820 [Candidatus Saganbacteria bacterium]|nr:hypothetical protein [Candidatus Saganbacteria bacterium]